MARYFPPQPEIYYQADAGGQLSLLDFEVKSDEPPDPDDFASIDAFREAIALWDAEHPELLEISLDSFSLWALCPDDWYEPIEVTEVLPAVETSITCNFSIPVFDAWCDRLNDTDEPPDTGICARLPKPKPPSFSPAVVAQGDRCPCGAVPALACDGTTVTHISPDGIVLVPCYGRQLVDGIAAARSPPGGDAVF